jgi:hypothetical protein
MSAPLVVNRRCGFRSARIFNATPTAALLVARSRTCRICWEIAARLDRVCQS